MSILYVVATPLGNLEDLSPRALRVLREANLILAEDTRVTARMLNAFEIKAPLESHHQHNEKSAAQGIVRRMLEKEMTVALVSDAGTPAISDPGAVLVAQAHQAGIQVLSVPGPSALAAALSLSGFDQGEHAFYGFLPRKASELRAKLKALQKGPPLAVLYESPHRVVDLLKAIAETYPGCRLSMSREISKLHEETLRGQVEEVLATFEQDEGRRRGEFALVLEVPPINGDEGEPDTTLSLEARLFDYLASGFSLRDARAELVKAGEKKNAVYAAALQVQKIAADLVSPEH